jgi:hypothetical protein
LRKLASASSACVLETRRFFRTSRLPLPLPCAVAALLLREHCALAWYACLYPCSWRSRVVRVSCVRCVAAAPARCARHAILCCVRLRAFSTRCSPPWGRPFRAVSPKHALRHTLSDARTTVSRDARRSAIDASLALVCAVVASSLSSTTRRTSTFTRPTRKQFCVP